MEEGLKMNCNEEFIVKLIGKLTLEFNYNWQEQRKVSEIAYSSSNNSNLCRKLYRKY